MTFVDNYLHYILTFFFKLKYFQHGCLPLRVTGTTPEVNKLKVATSLYNFLLPFFFRNARFRNKASFHQRAWSTTTPGKINERTMSGQACHLHKSDAVKSEYEV